MSANGGYSRSNDLGIGTGWWVRLATALGIAFLLLPLPIIVFFSFNANREVTHWTEFSLKWYRLVMVNRPLWVSIRNSVVIALSSSVLATILGTMAALTLAKHRFRGRALFQNLLYLPVVMPEIVFGLSLMILFVLLRMPLGFVSVICAHTTFSMSFVALIVLARLYSFNRHLEEASLDLGANRLQTFFHVVLPVISSSMVAAGVFAFTLSMDDFISTLFTSGVHSATLPLFIYSTLRYGVTPELNAISTLLILLTLVGLGGAWLLHKHPPPVRVVARIGGTVFGGALLLLAIAAFNARHRETLNFYNYSGYLDASIVADFERETGIRVNWSYFNTPEELFARLNMGVTDYDLVVPSDYQMKNMIHLGLLAPIDLANVPNLRHLDPAFRNLAFDPEGVYAVPYTYGSNGILYNSNAVRDPVDSWSIFWNPAYAGKMTLLDSMRDTLYVGFKYVGADMADCDPADLKKAADALIAQKKLLLRYESNIVESLLLAGDAHVVHYWSGLSLRVQMENPHIRFVLPKEGVAMFLDLLCIPANAPNKANAEKFIDFLLRPENAARNMQKIVYPMPYPAAFELLDPATRAAMDGYVAFQRENPDLMELIGDFGEYNKALDEAWTRVLTQ